MRDCVDCFNGGVSGLLDIWRAYMRISGSSSTIMIFGKDEVLRAMFQQLKRALHCSNKSD